MSLGRGIAISWLVAVCAVLSMGVAQAADSTADARARFLQAEEALRTGNTDRFETLAATLTEYPLYPYLGYQALRSRLKQVDDQRVEEFLREHHDAPVANRLRTAWLHRLGASKRWRAFLDIYQGEQGVALQCRYLQALIRTGRADEALEKVEPLWLHGRSQPSECDPVFAAWRAQQRLTGELVWGRIELAMQAGQTGLADYLKRFLPPSERPRVDHWLELAHTPAKVVDATRFDRTHPRDQQLRLWAMLRLARTDVFGAEKIWSSVRANAGFDDPQVAQVHRRFALSHAFRHRAAALQWFQILPESAADETVKQWRIMTALRHGRWPLVIEYIERLSTEERADERWRYWWARAAQATGREAEAHAEFVDIATQRNFYAFLAADILSLPYQFNHEPLRPAASVLEQMTSLPGVARARELVILRRWVDARREWRELLQANQSPDQQAALAVIAHGWDWHGRAIVTVAKAKQWNDLDLRFPTPHAALFETQASSQRLDTAWVYAVARQESAFMADARSPAGALGLMQIMPATGKQIAGQLKAPGFRTNKLLDPDVNVRFGAWYLRHLLGRVGENPVLVTAGYNAGPHRVDRWLPDGHDMPADIWVDTIPFSETRKYVRRVLAYTVIYERNLGHSGTRLSDRMPIVRAPG